jgi:hypothetical protein
MDTVAVYFHRYIYVPAEVNLQAHACARHYGRRWTCTVVVLVLARLVRCRGHARPALRTNAKRTQSAPRICRTDGRPAGESFWRTAQTFSSYHLAAQLGTPGYSDRRGALAVWLWPRLDAAVAASAAAAWSRSCLALPCLGLLGPAPPVVPDPSPAHHRLPAGPNPNSLHPYPPPASQDRDQGQGQGQGQGRPSSIAVPTATSTTAAGVWAGRHAARSHTSMDPVATCRASAGAPQFFTIYVSGYTVRFLEMLAHSSRCRCSHIHEERGWPRQPLWLAWFVSYSILSLFSSGRFWRGRRPPVHGSPTCPIPYLHCGRG